ncbi:MAG: hypothetical protein KBB13_07405 [Anaerolineaceae bacterium]|nr:hypothetical protein [Anaerolineaceae bacterium]HOG77875.1 hypothetical protein [Anaerolineaceae bacterium]
MPLSDDLTHYASIVSWKVKQQTQILHIQAQIHDLESQIGIQKTILAERTYEMYSQGALTDEPIRAICEKITALIAQKAEHQQELEVLRAQNPPEKPQGAAAPSQDAAPAQPVEADVISEQPVPAEASGEWVEPGAAFDTEAPSQPVEQSGGWVDASPTSETPPVEPPREE